MNFTHFIFTHISLIGSVGTIINPLKQNIMKYFNLLQPQEKDFIDALQSELGFTLENEFQKDFAVIKSALKDKFGPLKNSEDTTNLGIVLAQIKKAKEIQSYLQDVETRLIEDRDQYVQDIEKEFANW